MLALSSAIPSLNAQEPSSKKAKTSPPALLELPGDILKFCIIPRLTFQSFLAFELSSPQCMTLCRPRWKILLANHKLDFEWEECSTARSPDRTRFVLGKLVHAYALARLKNLDLRIVIEEPEDVRQLSDPPSFSDNEALYDEAIIDCFKGMIKRYPSFCSLVYRDLNSRIDLSSYKGHLKQSTGSLTSSDLLIEAILDILWVNDHDEETTGTFVNVLENGFDESLSKAIEANATCASLMAVQAFAYKREMTYITDAIFKSCDKKDFRALEEWLSVGPTEENEVTFELFEEEMASYPPFLTYRARKTKDVEQADGLFENAIEEYTKSANHVPPQVLFEAAKIKTQRLDYIKANELYSRAFAYSEANGIRIPALELWSAALLKKKLPGTTPDQIPNLFDAARARCKLGIWRQNWIEAEEICDKAMAATQLFQINLDDLFLIAVIKIRLNKYDEAEKLFLRIDRTKEMTPTILFHYAHVKSRLKKWKEADLVYIQARNFAKDRNEKVSPYRLMGAAQVKMELEQWAEADELWTEGFAGLLQMGKKVPIKRLISAAVAKGHLKKWTEADRYYTEVFNALEEKGENVPFLLSFQFAKIKMELEQWSAADELYTNGFYKLNRLIYPNENASNNGVMAAFVKSKLNQWKEAKNLLNQITLVNLSEEAKMKMVELQVQFKNRGLT